MQLSSNSPEKGEDRINQSDHNRATGIKLDIWDTAGEERYRNLAKIYYRDAQGLILVFDMTRPETFDAVQSWIQELNTNDHAKTAKLILGTKADAVMDGELDITPFSVYAKEQDALFATVSAKENIRVREAFETFVGRILADRGITL